MRFKRRFGSQIESLESRLLLSRGALLTPNPPPTSPAAEIGEFNPGEEQQDSAEEPAESSVDEAPAETPLVEQTSNPAANGPSNTSSGSNNSSTSTSGTSSTGPTNNLSTGTTTSAGSTSVVAVQPTISVDPVPTITPIDLIQPIDVIALQIRVVNEIDDGVTNENDDEVDDFVNNENDRDVVNHDTGHGSNDQDSDRDSDDVATEERSEEDQTATEEKHVFSDDEPLLVASEDKVRSLAKKQDEAIQQSSVETEPLVVGNAVASESPTNDAAFIEHVARTVTIEESSIETLEASNSNIPATSVDAGSEQTYSYLSAPFFAFALGAMRRRHELLKFDPVTVLGPGLPLNRDGSIAERKRKSKLGSDDGIETFEHRPEQKSRAIPTEDSAAAQKRSTKVIDAQSASASELMELVNSIPVSNSSYDQWLAEQSEDEVSDETLSAGMSVGGIVAAGAITSAATSVAIAKSQRRAKAARLQRPKAPLYTGDTIVRPVAN